MLNLNNDQSYLGSGMRIKSFSHLAMFLFVASFGIIGRLRKMANHKTDDQR